MPETVYFQLLRYLQDDLAVPKTSIDIALSHGERESYFLPMILWQQDAITLKQLDQILDWLEVRLHPTSMYHL